METLKADGYALVAATNGEKALKMVETDSPPDLILLDIMMPDMDGYEVCRRLQANENTRGIPIIFVTAKAEEEDELRGLGFGAVDYITKPISPPRVRARVKTHMLLRQARQRLEVQNVELREAARLREDVDNIMRHDLKSPLNSIVGTARILLQDRGIKKEDEESLEIIEASGYRMLNMINLSLDLMKMERGSYPLQAISLDLAVVIRRILSEVRVTSRSKDVALHLITEDRPLADEDRFGVFAEELLCYSMLSNLIKNAVEAAPEGGNVSIALGPVEKAAARIHIHNPGVVPEDMRERFFEKYATSGKSGGTGLGTYSAKLIAETQGGSIHLDTSKERGTTVTIHLIPASVDTISDAPTDLRPADPGIDEKLAARPPLHILLVDDDPDNRRIIKTYLNHPNVTVDTASDGEKGVERILDSRLPIADSKPGDKSNMPYDAVLMDIQMPVMDGFEATAKIRELESERFAPIRLEKRQVSGVSFQEKGNSEDLTPDMRHLTPIIGLSAHNDAAIREKCAEAGFDATLVKPVSRAELIQSILQLVPFLDDGNPALSERLTDRQEPVDETKGLDNEGNQYAVEIDGDLEDIIGAFLENKRADVNTMAEAVAGPNFDILQKLGHKLKGTFSMYGFVYLGQLCSGIEAAAIAKDIRTIERNLELLTDFMAKMTISYI